MSTTIDFELSKLKLNLSENTYSITAVSKAKGFLDSAESEAVSCSYGKETDITGTWLIYPNPTYSGSTLSFNVSGQFYGMINSKYSYITLKYIVLGYRDTQPITFSDIPSSSWRSGTGTQTYCNKSDKEWKTVYLYGGAGTVYSFAYSNTDIRTCTITSTLAEVENGEALLTWLNQNARKIS